MLIKLPLHEQVVNVGAEMGMVSYKWSCCVENVVIWGAMK